MAHSPVLFQMSRTVGHSNQEPGTVCHIPATAAVTDSLVASHILLMSLWPPDLTCLSVPLRLLVLSGTHTSWLLSTPVLAT